MLPADIHRSPRSIKNAVYSKVIQITNKETFILHAIITSSNELFNDCESDIAVVIWNLDNLTWVAEKRNVTVK